MFWPVQRKLIEGGYKGHISPMSGGKDKVKVKDKVSSKDVKQQDCQLSFVPFWKAYPNGTGKQKALDSWMKLAVDEALFNKIMASLKTHKSTPQWTKDAGQFVPHAATWLNQRRFDDDIKDSGNRPRTILDSVMGEGNSGQDRKPEMDGLPKL